jgi:hypothetical protein
VTPCHRSLGLFYQMDGVRGSLYFTCPFTGLVELECLCPTMG